MAQQGAAPQEAEARRSERAVRELLTSRLGQEEQAAFLPADVDRLLALDLVTPFRICAASKEELMRLGFSFGTAGALKAAFPSPGMHVDRVPWYTACLQEGNGRAGQLPS